MKLKKALSKAEYLERQAVKIARNKAFEDEEAKKIPYEVRTRGARDQLSVSAVRRRGVQREGGGRGCRLTGVASARAQSFGSRSIPSDVLNSGAWGLVDWLFVHIAQWYAIGKGGIACKFRPPLS